MVEKKWKNCVNYTVRNIEVGDGEETRIPEDKKFLMKCFKDEGVSKKDIVKLDKLIIENKYDLEYDKMRKILLPYRSHKDLYNKDWARWEWQTWNDPDEWKSYEEWKEDI